ncbi:variant erythrocyte surface antigen-1 family protein [Babesia caballi]|uniref:Variant erythrocyte surface antigen-1 family protein n=1 Tax=Babesia caballi TaxID=5871 RepID=A0AAV4LU03_BABCB|nr:variant erythrocyte surface antigen-1 family protein [Babesia caballi]
MGKSITNLADKLGKATENQVRSFPVLQSYLGTYKKNLENVRDYGSSVSQEDRDKLKGWLAGQPSGTIGTLAEGLKQLIGYQSGQVGSSGIGKNGSYKSKYHNDTARWSQSPDDKRTCALIFLGIGPMLFYGLTYLYWWCEGNEGWSKEQLTGSSTTLSKYMTAIGFQSTVLNSSKSKGSEVAGTLKTAFPKELPYAMQTTKRKALFIAAANANKMPHNPFKTQALSAALKAGPSYPLYLKTLEQRGHSTTDYPLSRSHIIASPFFTPNDTYTVHSSSPATPSFLGYSGLTALAGGTYGFNVGGVGTFVNALLAVTRKDGGSVPGGDNGAISKLSDDVKKLLQGVEVSGTGLGAEFTKVKDALGEGQSNLITKLAEGLQQFIGYKSGMINGNNTPIITGGGILPANVAKHQVCNAVLNFLIRFLEGLCGINVESPNKDVLKVLGTLRNCVGTGEVPRGFGTLVDGIAKKVENHSGFSGQVGPSLKIMFEKLKGIVTTASFEKGGGNNVEDLQEFLEQAFNGRGNNEQSGDFQKLCQNIANMFGDSSITNGSLSTDKHLELNSLNNAIGQVTTQANKLNPSKFKTGLTKALAVGVQSAAIAFIAELQTKEYTSFYNGADNKDVGNDHCAKIFLGCLPLYYQALTYIYWGCHDKGGGWRHLTLATGAMRYYFDSHGLLPLYVDRNKRGAHIAHSALKGFQEFGTAASSPFTYASFTTKLQENVGRNSNDLPSNCPLSALFYGASCYFRCQQITTAKLAIHAPKTIREMLYFLAALQFSSAYDELNNHIDTVLHSPLSVADSSQKTDGNTLTASQLKVSPCLMCLLFLCSRVDSGIRCVQK